MQPSATRSSATFLSFVAASLALALAELAWFTLRAPAESLRSLAVAALATAAVALLFGALLWLASRCVAALRDRPAWPACLAAWIFFELCAYLHVIEGSLARGALLALLAACAALFAWRLLAHVARRVDVLARPLPWLALALIALATLGAFGVRRASAHPHAAVSSAPRPSALLVTIDTLRADRVGAYGYAPARTPVFDALAARGALFEQAISHSVLTGPSHISILSGLLPFQHGVLENLVQLSPNVPTLAERLSARGWRTGAFVAGYPLKQDSAGLLERFDASDDDFRELRLLPELAYRTALGRLARAALQRLGLDFDPHSRSAEEVTDAALPWLASGDEPFFAWVHYFDPHLPYHPPKRLLSASARAYQGPGRAGDWYELDADQRRAILEDPAALAHMLELYDAEVAYSDEQLGRLIAAAKTRAGAGGLWVFVTADHGESFGEHGIFFERELYDDSLHVPLVIAPPESLALAPRRIASQVRLIDVAPTVLDALGVGVPEGAPGISLVPLIQGRTDALPGPCLSVLVPTRGVAFKRPSRAVRDGHFKAIERDAGWVDHARWLAPGRELYDLERDPAELESLEARHPEVFDEFQTLLHMRPSGEAARALNEHERSTLRQLGYAE